MKANKKKIALEQVLKALGDPVRLSAVKQLLNAPNQEMACGTFDHKLTKATFSHHIKILKDAQVFQSRDEGTRKYVSLNSELKKKYPSLIQMILDSED